MSAATIQFSCPQCHKKFSTPGSLAGKTVKCGCGAQVTVPLPQSAAAPPQSAGTSWSSPTPAPATISAPTPQPVTPPQYGAQPTPTNYSAPSSSSTTSSSSGGFGGGGAPTNRREFPALKYVAKCIDAIAWLTLVINTLIIVLVVIAAMANARNQGGDGGMMVIAAVAGGGIAFLFVALMVVFIRASAELIRLALYMAELLEDIRSNTA